MPFPVDSMRQVLFYVLSFIVFLDFHKQDSAMLYP